jgi:hypothetical protein
MSFQRSSLKKAAAYLAALLACSGVFAMYTHPEVLISLADQLWACF